MMHDQNKVTCVTSWLNLGVCMDRHLWKRAMSLFSDSIKAVSVRKDTYDDIVELCSEHEEADTRLLLHASHASRTSSRIVIQLPDTDVTDVAVFFLYSTL